MQHNQLRQFTELVNAYARALGEREIPWGMERGGETLTPVIDLWSRPEWAYLRGENKFWAQATAGAIAAERSILALRNPVGSGVLARVTLARSILDCTVRISTNLAIVADTTTTGLPRDGRLASVGTDTRSRVQFITASEATANAGTTVWEITLAGDSTRILPLDYILSPGRDLRLVGVLDLTALGGGFWWDERNALAGELE